MLLKYLFIFFFCTATSSLFAQQKSVLKNEAIKNIDAQYNTYKTTALQIWDYAELGFTEFKSSEALQNLLKTNGFDLKAGVAEMPTAFVATFGEGKPVIGILAEFDALPGLAQTIEPTKKSIEGKAAGHACGHHLFGTGSVAAAIDRKSVV